jgi:hypothetical protein
MAIHAFMKSSAPVQAGDAAARIAEKHRRKSEECGQDLPGFWGFWLWH